MAAWHRHRMFLSGHAGVQWPEPPWGTRKTSRVRGAPFILKLSKMPGGQESQWFLSDIEPFSWRYQVPTVIWGKTFFFFYVFWTCSCLWLGGFFMRYFTSLIASEVSRINDDGFLKIMFTISSQMFKWFWYMSDNLFLCIVSGVVLHLCYDVDTVSDMIMIWFQLWFLMWVIIVIWSQPTGTISKILSQPDQNRIKIMSKAQKPWRNRPKGWPGAVSVSFLGFTLPEPWKRRSVPKACQKHFKITSKSKHIPKPYPNHKPIYIKNIRTISKSWPKFKAYQIHIFFKTILKS